MICIITAVYTGFHSVLSVQLNFLNFLCLSHVKEISFRTKTHLSCSGSRDGSWWPSQGNSSFLSCAPKRKINMIFSLKDWKVNLIPLKMDKTTYSTHSAAITPGVWTSGNVEQQRNPSKWAAPGSASHTSSAVWEPFCTFIEPPEVEEPCIIPIVFAHPIPTSRWFPWLLGKQ